MNERIELTIEKLVHGGKGLARLGSGQAVFVSGVLPGERVVVAIKRKRKGILEADLIEVLTSSQDRIDPPCIGEKQCTGATWPHIAYPAQLRFKQEILLDTLAKIGGITPTRPLSILPSPRIDHYRLRAQFNVRPSGGKQQIGFFRPGSYDLIEVDDAFLIDPLINRTLKAVRSLEPQLPPLKEVHINATPAGEVHLLLYGEQDTLPSMNAFFFGLRKAVPEVVGITGFANRKKAFTLGNNRLTLECEGLTFHATERNFYQVNWEQNRNMVKTVLDFAALAGDEIVLDLYCGIGNFALPLAKQAKTVIGVESGYTAIDDAKANAILNGIENTEFIADDLQRGLKTLMQRKMRAPTIVLDPPRSGATLKTLERVLAFVPQKIIYVSCNPSTLARDLKFFHLFGLRLDRLQPVDMFPWTYHIECVAEMARQEK
ncbi:MAG TPA: 23S rRNA (uracil(1939)-C(5))-methyltransferase RlmD [Nitrospirota bacterium]|nr:23S rRNA (uracil(1939)-C(5))-methyltransferase RlmD [Nitrospirota bacterium]